MFVFSNRRIGPAAELLVSAAVAESMLRETAAAARVEADARWEQEAVRWLEARVGRGEDAQGDHPGSADGARGDRLVRPGAAAPAISRRRPHTVIDVAEIAWTPENFDRQRQFLLRAIERAAETSEHARALRLWAQMIEAHPRDSVQFGRRWTSQSSF